MELFASNVVLGDAAIVDAVGGGGEGIIGDSDGDDGDEEDGGVYSGGSYGDTYELRYKCSSIQPSVDA